MINMILLLVKELHIFYNEKKYASQLNKGNLSKTGWESSWSSNTFLPSKLSLHFRHWKEVEVINMIFLSVKKLHIFYNEKKYAS